MRFAPAPDLGYIDIPIAYVIELGGEELLGLRDRNGGFRQIDSLREIPDTDWRQVQMFGPSLGLLKPCTAAIVLNEKQVGSISIGVVDERPGCVSIHCTTHALTGSLLRQIPLASLVREAALTSTVRVLSTSEGFFGARYVDGGLGFGHLMNDLREELAAVGDDARRRVINRAFLSEVASIYREALAIGSPPAKAVQDALGPTTPENARRWVSQARREGLLGSAPGLGRAGEVQELSASS